MSDTATGPWREALGFVDQLLNAEPARRETLLSELAATRPELHSRVRALMDADAEATRTGFLRVPARAESGTERVATLAPGTRLGPYRIERELGTGGMGEVWLAQRDDGLYEGEVAIKTLHPFFAHGVLRERFLREAQLLGKLTHPNIARLLDAGVADGVVYLVLEYVRGEPLDVYCDSRNLGIRARLKLFGDVCAAVAHAHANLVIHRDIKPSNILVSDQGQVKLLDFGIGKLMDPGAAERTQLTRVTGRIFTPEFAAPEQIRGEAVTTATDVYSLGTLLYLLLTGVRPFGELTGSQVEHAVLHDEPRSPVAAARDVSTAAAAGRGVSPAQLARGLAGDLEDIVLLALRRTPQQRYSSVTALSDDLGRYLRHEPVLARAGSRAYRVNRFVRRHRVAVAASIGVLIAAAVGVAGVLYQARAAREQARMAQREAEKATRIKDYLLAIFAANSAENPDGAAARKTTAEQLMDIATKKILVQEELDPEVRDDLMSILQDIHADMEKFAEQEALGKARIALAEKYFGVADVRLADAYNQQAELFRSRQRFDEARAAALKAVELREAQGDHASWTRALSEYRLGQIGFGAADLKDREPIEHFLSAIRMLEKLPPDEYLVRSYLGLARTYERMELLKDAEAANDRGLELAIRILGPNHEAVAGAHQQQSRVMSDTYRFEDAERHLAEAMKIFTFAYGPTEGRTVLAMQDLARTRMSQGKFRETVEMLSKGLEYRTRAAGTDDIYTQQFRSLLLSAHVFTGDFARAQAVSEDLDAALGIESNRRMIPGVRRQQAMFALEQGRARDALPLIDEALSRVAGKPQDDGAFGGQARANRAEILIALGRVAEAKAVLDDAEARIAKTEEDPGQMNAQLAKLARVSANLAEKKFDDARAGATGVIGFLQASPRRAHLWFVEDLAQRRLATAELALGDRKAACAALDAAIALRTSNSLPVDPRLAAARELRKQCP